MLNNTTNYSFFTIHFSLFINCTKRLPISSTIIILEMDSSDYFLFLLNYIVCVYVCYSPNVFRFCSFFNFSLISFFYSRYYLIFSFLSIVFLFWSNIIIYYCHFLDTSYISFLVWSRPVPTFLGNSPKC